MSAKTLWNNTGTVEPVHVGESSDVEARFFARKGVPVLKASLVTLTATIYDRATCAVINDRNAQDVLDANHGTVADVEEDGVTAAQLTLRLGPSDNVIVGASVAVGALEEHVVRLQWTWSDGVETRNGFDEWVMQVEKVAVPI